jgi:Zn-dependent peptidase ImmA (M78 family)
MKITDYKEIVQAKKEVFDIEYKNIVINQQYHLKIAHSDWAVARFFNVPARVPMIGVVNLADDDRLVVYNSAILTAPEAVFNAFIAHELGHILLGHSIVEKLYMVKRLFRLDSREVQADAMAVKIGFDIKMALEWYISNTSDPMSKREIEWRIAALNN